MGKYDKLLEGARAHLDPGEEIIEAVQGTYETKIMGNDSVRSGLLVATDRRIVFFAKKLGGYDLESFAYNNVSSIEMSKQAMMGHRISFFASGNKVAMKWIQDLPRLGKFMEYVRGRLNEKSGPPPQAGAAEPDAMDQLKKLGELRDAGVLTPEEFEAKKADILKRL